LIKSQPAIASFGQMVFNNNEHLASLEITEAATIKADGRRIPVAADRILVSALPNSPVLGIFQADVKVHTIIFPDVAVGDTIHYTTRTRERAPRVAGGFSVVRVAPPPRRVSKAWLSRSMCRRISNYIARYAGLPKRVRSSTTDSA
jgi:hypothetical protein